MYLAHGSNGETYNTGRVAVNILGVRSLSPFKFASPNSLLTPLILI